MDDLAKWLREQLDEDERIARGADPEPTAEDLEFGDSPSAWTDPHGEFQGRGGPVFAHVLRHDPARALRRVDSDRRILDEVVDEATGLDIQVDNEFRVGTRDTAAEPYLGDVLLRLLALPYADRPGYREEWRP